MNPPRASSSHHPALHCFLPRLGYLITSLAGICVWAFACSSASAQTELIWDASPGTAGQQDGNGTWSTGGGNWLNPATGTNTTWPAGTGTIAEFGNGTGPISTSRTITVSGTVGVGGMVFNPATNDVAYQFSGGTIQFADGAVINLLNGSTGSSANKRLTFNSVLSGSNVTIVKTPNGATTGVLGAVQLNGVNTWTGTLTLLNEVTSSTDGLFVQAKAASINSLDRVVVGDLVTMTVAEIADYTVPIEIGVGSLNRGAIRFDAAGDIAGELILRGDSSVSSNVATDEINVNGTISGTISEMVAGSSLSINVNGTQGMLELKGDNTFTGGVIIHAGILRIGSEGALNADAPNLVTFGPTTTSSSALKRLQLNGTSVAVGGLTLGNGSSTNNFVENNGVTDATLTIDNRLNYSFSGVLRDGNEGGRLALTKTGTGIQTLTGGNVYSGDTTIRAGTLSLNFGTISDNVINNGGNNSALVMQGGTLRLVGTATLQNSQQFNGLRVESGSSTILLSQNATTPQNLMLSVGEITRTGGYVNFILPSGEQNSINGVLATNTAGLLGTWATVNGEDWAAVNASGNVVAFTGYQTVTNFSTGTGAVGPIPNSPTAHVKIIDGGTSGNVLLGNPTGTTDIASLVVDATGPTVIEINNSADPSSGTLRIGTDGAIMLAAGAGALTIGDQTTAGATLTAGGPTANTAGNLVFYNYSTNAITVNAGIMNNGTGAVTLVKNGTGLLVLNSSNSNYSGGTVFNGGTVQIRSDAALGALPGSFDADNLTFNGGALQLVPLDAATPFVLNSNRGITLLDGGGAINVSSNTAIYNGVISGSGDFIKAGGSPSTGTLRLGGANTYTGETVVSGGILEVAHNQALGSTAGGTVVGTGGGVGPVLRLLDGIVVTGETLTIYGNGNNNGALTLAGGSTAATATSAAWMGDIFLGATESRIGVTGFGTLTIGGVIQDGAASSIWFSANGSTSSPSAEMGVVLLTNQSTYTGHTGIVRGTVKLGIDNALPTGTVLTVYTANSVKEVTAFDLNGFDQTIGGLSSVVPASLNFAMGDDAVNVTNSNAANASTLTVDQATDQTYNGRISGNLALTKTGSGKLTLTNAYNQDDAAANPSVPPTLMASTSTYTGKTTISGGTLALTGTGNIEGTPWIQVDQGAFFDVSGRTGGGYDLTNKTLSGTGTVTGNITISGTSILKPGGNAATATLAQAGNGTGALTVNGDLTLATGGTRALFQLGGTNSSLFDSSGVPEFFADASSDGLYDQVDINGTLNLSAGGTIKIEFADGYTANSGDVFNLMDWLLLGPTNTFTLADLDLSAVSSWGNGLHFETDRFLSHGILYVAVPEPSKALLLLSGLVFCTLRRRRTTK